VEQQALAADACGVDAGASAGGHGHGHVAAAVRPVDGGAAAEVGMLLPPAVAVEPAAAVGEPAGAQRGETVPTMQVARAGVRACSRVHVHASAKVNGRGTWGATRGTHVRWRWRRTRGCVPQGPTLLSAVAGTM